MKYIVYLTTNLKSTVNGINRIYIGVHKVENPEIQDTYLGCGVLSNKPSSYMFPKTAFLYAVKKYGPNAFKRSTLFVYDTPKEAFDKEAEIVNSDFIKQSHTYNTALGGRGGEIVEPKVHSLPIYQFDLLGNQVNYWETTVDASDFYECSVHKITKAANSCYEYLGYFWSRNEKIKLSQYKTDHKKYTYLYDSNGKLLSEFISRTECANYIGCCPQSVSKAITHQLSIKGYYVSDTIVDLFTPKPRISLKSIDFYLYEDRNFLGKLNRDLLFSIIKIKSSKKLDSILNSNNGWYKDYFISTEYLEEIPSKKHHNKRIEVYSLEGKLLEVLKSVKEVKEKYNLNSSEITKILKGIKNHGQYIFKYSK